MPRPSPVPSWVPDDLPPSPGVYAFADETGHPLYVGKSVNVRRRVRSYFYGGGPADERIAEMLRIARGVTAQRTGSDLEARLEEAERILDERPPYNRALKRRGRGWYLEVWWKEPFPRLRVVRRPRRAGSRYFGPFWGRRLPERIRRLTEKTFTLRSCTEALRPDPLYTPCIQFDLDLCPAPCARRIGLDEYRARVARAVQTLADREHAAEERARFADARDRASESLAFEEAARQQARIGWLDELEEYRFALGPGRRERSWLIVLPGASEGTGVLQPVARGRVLPRRTVDWQRAAWESAVEDLCYAIRVAELRARSVLDPRESVPSLMVERWLEDGAPDGIALDLDRLDTAGAVTRLRRATFPG